MGLRHSKPPEKNYTELLEKLEDEILYFERSEVQLRLQEWRMEIGFLLFVSATYVLLIYMALWNDGRADLRWLFVIFFGYPCVLYFIRRLVALYFQRRLSYCASRLTALRTQRAELIDEVKDKQSYNVAKQLLDRFETPIVCPAFTIQPANHVFYLQNPKRIPDEKIACITVPGGKEALPSSAFQAPADNPASASLPPRPILPYQRSFWDRIVDIILRDGPSNRYALICVYCKGHNGMAMAEEFEDMTSRCCYCNMLNSSRRQMRMRHRVSVARIQQKENDQQPSDASSSSE